MKTSAGLMSRLKCIIRDNGGNVNSKEVYNEIRQFENQIKLSLLSEIIDFVESLPFEEDMSNSYTVIRRLDVTDFINNLHEKTNEWNPNQDN